MRILVVEDEKNLAEVIANRLKKDKFIVDIALDGELGEYYALSNAYDLIVLDIMLPKRNGFEILKSIREKNIDTKVIMLTARADIDDRLNGFNLGANDYIPKPFHLEELMARVNVWLNNKNILKDNNLRFKDITLNLDTCKISSSISNKEISISGKEFMIFEYLMINKEKIITKEQLYDKVWGIDSEIESNSLEAYLSFLRKKLKLLNSDVTIKSVRGVGYKMGDINEEI